MHPDKIQSEVSRLPHRRFLLNKGKVAGVFETVLIHGKNLVIIHLVYHIGFHSQSSGVLHVKSGRDGVAERRIRVQVHVLQFGLAAVL